MKKIDLFCDLNLSINYLNEKQIAELITETISDGFNIIGLNKTLSLGEEYFAPKFNNKNFKNTLILKRITILIRSEKDFKSLKNLRLKYKDINLLALNFEDSKLMEKFLERYEKYEDNIISLNISKFQFSTKILKLLSKKNFALEICYKDILYTENQKLAFINLFKVFDSHFKNVIFSSNASNVFERRAKWELGEFLKGCLDRSKFYHSRLFLNCVSIIPVDFVKEAKLRSEGGVSFVKSN